MSLGTERSVGTDVMQIKYRFIIYALTLSRPICVIVDRPSKPVVVFHGLVDSKPEFPVHFWPTCKTMLLNSWSTYIATPIYSRRILTISRSKFPSQYPSSPPHPSFRPYSALAGKKGVGGTLQGRWRWINEVLTSDMLGLSTGVSFLQECRR